MSDRIEVVPEWALWGKEPSGLASRVLRCSDGNLNDAGFTRIMQRYSTGTHTDLPQVTLSWARAQDEAYIGMAIQRWTDDRDHTGRKIAMAHYCALPYSRLDRPVSYEAIYHALSEWAPPPEGVTAPALRLPVLRPEAVASRATEHAMGVAALLLTGAPVHIVPSGQVPSYLERLRFLDTVASLLPYGMRTELSAATWVSSTSQSRIRLAFTRHAGKNAHAVRWGVVPSFAELWNTPAHRYAELLAAHADTEDRAAEVVRRLAEQRDSLDWGPGVATQALQLLRAQLQAPEQRIEPPSDAEERFRRAEETLRACEHAVLHNDGFAFHEAVARLQQVQDAPLDEGERSALWNIAVNGGLFSLRPRPGDDHELDRLHEACLRLGFGPTVDRDSLYAVEQDLPSPVSPRLLNIMARMATGDRLTSLAIAIRMRWGLTELLAGLSNMDLAQLAVQQEREDVLKIVYGELCGRAVHDHDTSVQDALDENGFFAGPIARFYPQIYTQYTTLRNLLAAAFGPTLDREQFARIVRFRQYYPPTPALVFAALSLHEAPDAGETLTQAYFRNFLGLPHLPNELRNLMEDALTPRPVPPTGAGTGTGTGGGQGGGKAAEDDEKARKKYREMVAERLSWRGEKNSLLWMATASFTSGLAVASLAWALL
ncbi:serine/threonine-protein kinase [Actinomadura algeriensis]|uniref:Uncharacterized protein n=1 Tax=Actinomadura algeriensis TaxID=1679523 RepID=A0ABR9JJI2_9ACTN|nr:hypothetical protein [Actinomadura algeriensis]MBE1530709.1 hypothetical protein [Actinomadura algeriensis]